MTNYTDKYTVEVELKTVSEEDKHPTVEVEMTKVSHADFMKIKRDPELKEIIKQLTMMAVNMKETPKDEEPSKATLDEIIKSLMLTSELLELGSVIVIDLQHPGLRDTLSKQGGDVLVNAVIDNDMKEAFGMGEALKALKEVTEEPKPKPSKSTTTDLTPSASTTSSSKQDGQTDKS